jgi:hypothetical protein
VHLELGPTAVVAAPASGVQLGLGRDGPLTLRLFRAAGTRLALAARVFPAQLIALRAAVAGTPVQVLTTRPQLWQPLLRDGGSHVVSSTEVLRPSGGPTLLVDDRAVELRGPADVRPWQCRIDVRTQWTYADISAFGRADLAIFGAVPPDVVTAVATAFGVPAPVAQPLAQLDSGSFGVLRRGRVEYVSLDPTAAESQVLELARVVAPDSAPLPAGAGRYDQTIARSQLDATRTAP